MYFNDPTRAVGCPGDEAIFAPGIANIKDLDVVSSEALHEALRGAGNGLAFHTDVRLLESVSNFNYAVLGASKLRSAGAAAWTRIKPF